MNGDAPPEDPYVEATALVAADPEDVYEFLSDLRNHWLLTDRFVDVLELTGPPDMPASGGTVRIHGPLGLRRTASTRVTASRAPRLLIGLAELGEPGACTRARVSWTLAGRMGKTRVRLAAEIERAQPLDRLLLAIGGRAWLRRCFAQALAQLAQRFEDCGSAAVPVHGRSLDDDPARALARADSGRSGRARARRRARAPCEVDDLGVARRASSTIAAPGVARPDQARADLEPVLARAGSGRRRAPRGPPLLLVHARVERELRRDLDDVDGVDRRVVADEPRRARSAARSRRCRRSARAPTGTRARGSRAGRRRCSILCSRSGSSPERRR